MVGVDGLAILPETEPHLEPGASVRTLLLSDRRGTAKNPFLPV
jgi:hypothetical protein